MKRERSKSNIHHKIGALLCAALCCTGFAGCSPAPGTPHHSAAGIPDRFTAEEDKIAVFSQGDADGFFAADGWKNGFPFNCHWKGECIRFDGGVMSMTVRQEEDGSFSGAEYR